MVKYGEFNFLKV